ncbi:hypothetical protein Tco_0336536 [Tanacetum coccineum]
MDWYTKNALWLYWKRGDDEEVLTYDEFSDLEEENLSKDNEIAEIFRIEMDIFNFETPLCKEFKEFNHHLQIDVDVLTGDLSGFKTYEDYKVTWIYKWNNEVSWVEEKQWTESWGPENREGKNFCSWLKESFSNYHELDYELMMKSEEYWRGKKYEEESSKDAWSNYLPNDDNDAIQANQ